MRRRHGSDDGAGAPLRLRRYRPEEWQGIGCHPECSYWAARLAWLDEHPDDDLHELEPGPDGAWHPELI